jgi:putative two-component system response regulator
MSPRVLFVDDDESFLDGLRRVLHAYHPEWTMTFVPSAKAALQEMSATTVDTVVADLRMPYQDGFDLLQRITTSRTLCHVPIIIMTGAAERDLKRRALDYGATDLLSKPVDVEELIARIRNAIRLKTYQDQIHGQNDLLERKVRERTQALDASRIDLIWRLGRVAEFRDEQTGNHIMRVGAYCKVLAETLGMPREFAETIFLTSPLHDIGKIGIPDGILLRPGKLTAAEWDIMRRHCALGAELLRQDTRARSSLPIAFLVDSTDEPGSRRNPFLEMASSIALAHHEWWDGTGYPRRLAGEAIPLEARIVAVADVYDALCSVRPYKPAFPEKTMLGIMKEKVGSHFDPAVYAAFLRSFPAFRDIRRRLTDHAAAA